MQYPPARRVVGSFFVIMPKKTWFQHDMNCRKKEGLSLLIKVGGNEGYGMFWRLQELYAEMQIHKQECTNFFTINEASLVKELGINRRRLLKVMQLFSETCAIVFENIPKTIGYLSYNNIKITLPKSLIFMTKRIPKKGHSEESKSKKENKSKSKNKNGAERKTLFKNSQHYEYSVFREALKDWEEEKVKHYYRAAKEYCEAKGMKYIDWVSAVRNWDRMRPGEWKKGKGLWA